MKKKRKKKVRRDEKGEYILRQYFIYGKIQEIKAVGRGYRKFENFRSAILFFHGGLRLYPLKW